MKLIMWILVFAFLGTIIFSWGMGGFKDKTQAGIIGEIDGDEIKFENFQRIVQRQIELEARKEDKELDKDKLKRLREDTWDEYIENHLKVKNANQLGIKVTDHEIAHIIENFPPAEVQKAEIFQRDGKFDLTAYQNFLRTPQASKFLIGLESSVRDYLLQQKLHFHVTQAVDVTEEEILDAYLKDNTTGKLRFITVQFDNVDFDSSEITEQMMRRYYRLFPGKFKQYPQSQFAYVKFKVEPSVQDTADVKRDAEELLTEIQNGADFAELANEWSQDESNASDGGDLGWFGRGKMVSQFDDAAFAAKSGDIIGPVETRFGLHIIKIEDRRKGEDGEEIKARHILLKIEPSADTRDEVNNEAYNFSQEIAEHGFDQIVQEMGYAVDTTREFSAAGYIAGLGRMRMAAQFCLNNPLGSVSGVYPYPQGYIVFTIVSKVEEGTKPYEDVENSIPKRLKKVINKNKAWNIAADIRSMIDTADDLDRIAEQEGYTVHTTDDSLKPGGSLPDGLSGDNDFLTEAFRLDEGEISDIIEGKKGYYIAFMMTKSEFDKADYSFKHALLYQQLIRKKQDAATRNWIRELRIAAYIQDYRYKYFRDF